MATHVPLSMMFPLDPRLSTFRQSIRELSAKERKAIVTLCRAQYVPSRSEAKILSYQVFGDTLGTFQPNSPLKRAVMPVTPFIENPLYSGLVLDITRCQEPTSEEIDDMRKASWLKEVAACNTGRRSSSINFKAIFDPQHFEEELIPNVKARPEVNAYIHQLLVTWRSRSCERVQFPRMSNKASSRWSTRIMDQVWPGWQFDKAVNEDQLMSQIVMEKLYAETGIAIGGGCELRQRLDRANMTPRTYFAQGGSAYHSSKHLQDVCSNLVDILPTSNHILRLIPTNLRLDNPLQHVFIYDLTSFTSLFHEFLPFIRYMAEFCRGHDIHIWDGRRGEEIVDFGALWDDYAEHNANLPPYSAERWTNSEEDVFYHMCAGFLGVYGNLMICTFVHAVVVLGVIGDAGKCYTAGDDGGAVMMALLILVWDHRSQPPRTGNNPYDDVFILFYALSLLGIIQWSKVFTSQEMGAIALKRPLRQVEGILTSPQMVVWPQSILIKIYREWHSHRDPRYNTYYMLTTRRECREGIIAEMTRFLSSVAAMEHRADDEYLAVIRTYCVWVYETINAPKEGFVPQFSSITYNQTFVPTIEKSLGRFRKDPIQDTIAHLWSNCVIVPCRIGRCNYDEEVIDLSIGSEFVSRGNRQLGWLFKLGYLERETLLEEVYGEVGFNMLLKEYHRDSGLPPQLYKYRVNNLPPCLYSDFA